MSVKTLTVNRYRKRAITAIRKNDESKKKCNNIPIVSQASLLILSAFTDANVIKKTLNISKLMLSVSISFG
jgi:hypothetical protein